MLEWTSSTIHDTELISNCFKLLHRQYALVGEMKDALSRTCVIKQHSDIDELRRVCVLNL